MNVLAIDGALGAFSAAIARDGRDPRCALRERSDRARARIETRRRTPRTGAAKAARNGPIRGWRRSRRLHRLAHRGDLRKVARRCRRASAGAALLVRSARVRRHVRSRARGRGRAPGVVSVRYRAGAETRRASGRTGEVLAGLFPSPVAGTLPVIGAPKDVLGALAERAIIVQAFHPAVVPAAAAAALAAFSHAPPASVHGVRADYGELPAARPPTM